MLSNFFNFSAANTNEGDKPRTEPITIVFLGGGAIVSRLPEILARAGVRIVVFGPPGNALAHSEFVDEYHPLSASPEHSDATWSAILIEHAAEISRIDSDWFIVENDTVASELARSDVPLAVKLKILPCRSEAALTIMGSKVGLAVEAQRLGLNFAHTEIAQNLQELAVIAARWDGPAHLKADLGGGGAFVVAHQNLCGADLTTIPEEWFPLIVQRTVVGPVKSVEALFVQGELAGWIYSGIIHNVGKNGPSLRRRYHLPPSEDFVETLKKLGQECQLHGFFNCTFIWSKTTRTHWLFEADPRPNPWHQFGPRLGVDWIELMRFPSATVVGPTLPRHPTILGLYPRTIIAFGLSKNVTIILPWLLGLPGTWRTRNTRDAAINAMEKAIVWESLGITKRRNRLRRFWSRLRARSGRDS